MLGTGIDSEFQRKAPRNRHVGTLPSFQGVSWTNVCVAEAWLGEQDRPSHREVFLAVARKCTSSLRTESLNAVA